jgi:hypothetical protein
MSWTNGGGLGRMLLLATTISAASGCSINLPCGLSDSAGRLTMVINDCCGGRSAFFGLPRFLGCTAISSPTVSLLPDFAERRRSLLLSPGASWILAASAVVVVGMTNFILGNCGLIARRVMRLCFISLNLMWSLRRTKGFSLRRAVSMFDSSLMRVSLKSFSSPEFHCLMFSFTDFWSTSQMRPSKSMK